MVAGGAAWELEVQDLKEAGFRIEQSVVGISVTFHRASSLQQV